MREELPSFIAQCVPLHSPAVGDAMNKVHDPFIFRVHQVPRVGTSSEELALRNTFTQR